MTLLCVNASSGVASGVENSGITKATLSLGGQRSFEGHKVHIASTTANALGPKGIQCSIFF